MHFLLIVIAATVYECSGSHGAFVGPCKAGKYNISSMLCMNGLSKRAYFLLCPT